MFDFRFYELWRSPEYVQTLLMGVGNSFWLTLVGSVFGIVFGVLLALAQGRGMPFGLRFASMSYVEFVRNTPFIVQLFFVVFGLPLLLGYTWSLEASVVLAITLNFAAYYGEVIRAGIQSVPQGQVEGAMALGMSRWQTIFDVVLPQAIAKVYPSMVSQFVFLFLTTGLVSEIGVKDLTWAGRFVAGRTFRDFEVFIVLTILYMLLVYIFKGGFAILFRTAFPWWGKSR
ncbi:MAG: amino acid ABC transporter permease [Pelagimonas sp.]|uniref:amino acid ABC transporter permease n=1 Tax=Pelagimonas sp. TaxID=2073170 RepID=UPI003D6A3AF2